MSSQKFAFLEECTLSSENLFDLKECSPWKIILFRSKHHLYIIEKKHIILIRPVEITMFKFISSFCHGKGCGNLQCIWKMHVITYYTAGFISRQKISKNTQHSTHACKNTHWATCAYTLTMKPQEDMDRPELVSYVLHQSSKEQSFQDPDLHVQGQTPHSTEENIMRSISINHQQLS